MSLKPTATNCGQVLDDSRDFNTGNLSKISYRQGLRKKFVFPLQLCMTATAILFFHSPTTTLIWLVILLYFISVL